jgi:hypothetical protein
MAQSYQNVNNDLNKMVPFLLERKYCYYEPNSRNNMNMSRYNFNTAQKPLIAKYYNNNKQIDDIIKDNFVNVYTNNLLKNVQKWMDNSSTLSILQELYNSTVKLNKYQKNTLTELNKTLNNLHNQKYFNTRKIESTKYNLNKYNYYTTLCINTVLIFCIIFIINDLGKQGVIPFALYINFFFIGLAAVYIMLSLNSIIDRMGNDFNQFEFRQFSMDSKQKI